jgi:cation diffusion facilitator CzcD-associated flavoprotein CzcO
MSGLLMGIRLKQAGIDTFDIYEKDGAVGGTWRDNTYPGLSCDVPAYTYTYSFEPNPHYTHRYARGAQIRGYFERAADKYRVRPHIHFNKEIVRAIRDDGGWAIEMKDGEKTRADIVVTATGVLHHPRTPDIAGLESFAGAKFHTARWDHGVGLEGKRVGLIGTGSTAVQITCALPDKVGKLSVFQRTAQWVCPRFDTKYSERTRSRAERFPFIAWLKGQLLRITFETTFTRAVVGDRLMLGIIDRLVRKNLAKVKDPELRKKLTPDYQVACKRLIFADEFYDEIQKPNVELVTEAIDHIEPRGVVTKDGRLHELDVLVLATGFQALRYLWPMEVVGEQGRKLAEVWGGAPKAYRTVAVPGFPNFFMLMGPHSPVGNYSLIGIAEDVSSYILQFVEMFARGEYTAAQPKSEPTERYNEELRDALKGTIWVSGCRSWYLDSSGLPNLWPWTAVRFRRELKRPALDEFHLQTETIGGFER